MTIDGLWDEFDRVSNKARGFRRDRETEGLRAVLRAVLDAGPKSRPDRIRWPEADAADSAWNDCCEAWRDNIEEMLNDPA